MVLARSASRTRPIAACISVIRELNPGSAYRSITLPIGDECRIDIDAVHPKFARGKVLVVAVVIMPPSPVGGIRG